MNAKAELKDRLQLALDLNEKKPIDLANALNIAKSSISMYLSGDRTIKDSKRIYAIAKYLNVSEAWLMGYDVPMERPDEKKEKSTDDSELSMNKKKLMQFVETVPDDKVDMVLRVMKSMLEAD